MNEAKLAFFSAGTLLKSFCTTTSAEMSEPVGSCIRSAFASTSP
eukprot:CAMPEP_0176238054 /NCGR_PEP_ID=MMETSP0121_2-20121125/28168_1 /TAXON_ID=160619 /ORGANISM="Kryptoperidinium foliaceum, Strain CCMP 1326" /LENGTH=43 /DNA_ID= /DNA_START= /DNA_END= /DNA_ORIENTATION=